MESVWFATRKVFLGTWRSSSMGCAYCGKTHARGQCPADDAPSNSSQTSTYNCEGRSFLQIQAMLKKHTTKVERAKVGADQLLIADQ